MLSLTSPRSALRGCAGGGVFGDVAELVVDAQQVLDHLVVQLARETLALLLAFGQEPALRFLQGHVRLVERLDLATELLDELLVERALRFQAPLEHLLLLAQAIGLISSAAEAVERPEGRRRLSGSVAPSRSDTTWWRVDLIGPMGRDAGTVPEDDDAVGDRKQVLQVLAAEDDRGALLSPRLDQRQQSLLRIGRTAARSVRRR